MHTDLLRQVLTVARRLGASADLDEILWLIIDVMRDGLDAERATVFEYDSTIQELRTSVAHGVESRDIAPRAGEVGSRLTEIRMPATAGLAGEAARRRELINVPDAYADPRFYADVDRRSGFRTRSVLSVPMITHDEELVGVAQVLNKRKGVFISQDEEVAIALAAQAALAMKRGQLIEDRLVRVKLEHDLELARKIQQGTFPTTLPHVPPFELGAWSEPADQTGGDAFDVIGPVSAPPSVVHATEDVSSSRIVLLLADATGHGVGPALSATQVRAMLRMAVRLGADLSSIARHMNEQFREDLPSGRFVTAWLGELEVQEGTLRSFSAGQAPLIWYHAASSAFETRSADTIPLGLMGPLGGGEPARFTLEPGDLFAVISDGVFEAESPNEEPFGLERVLDVLRHTCREAPETMIAELRLAVSRFTEGAPAEDDRTGLIIARRPGSLGVGG